MVKIIGPAGSGKTRKIMELCEQQNAVFVCKSPEAMFVKAKAYGYNIHIISYIDFLQNSTYNDNNAYLDDIDEFLMVIGCHCLGFGGTTEEGD